jgi:choline dehydrogenase-like flavoprotein
LQQQPCSRGSVQVRSPDPCDTSGIRPNSLSDPENLRAADVSVLPTISASDGNAAAILVGEEAAEFILNDPMIAA